MLLNKLFKRVTALFAVTLFISCSPYQDIEIIEVTKVGVSSVDENGEAKFVVSAKIKNPNSYQIYLKDAEIDVDINGINFGTFSLEKGIKLKRNEISEQDFFITLDLKSLLKQNFLQAASLLIADKVEIKLTGFVEVSNFGISHQIEVNVLQDVSTNKNWLKI